MSRNGSRMRQGAGMAGWGFRFSNRCIAAVTAIAMAALPPASAGAPKASKTAAAPQTYGRERAVINTIFNMEPQQMLMLLAIDGAKEDAIRAIHLDIARRLKGLQKTPTISLKENLLLIDGVATGARIVSFVNMTVEYKGKTFAFDRSRTADDNYFRFLKFMGAEVNAASRKAPPSLWDVVIPRAEAQRSRSSSGLGTFNNAFATPGEGALNGAVLGGGIGILAMGILSATGSVKPGTAMLYAGLISLAGAALGGIWGSRDRSSSRSRSRSRSSRSDDDDRRDRANRGDRREAREIVAEILSTDTIEIRCDTSSAIVYGASGASSRIEYTHARNEIAVFNDEDSRVTLNLSADQRQLLEGMRSCQDNAQSARLRTALVNGRNVFGAAVGPRPAAAAVPRESDEETTD